MTNLDVVSFVENTRFPEESRAKTAVHIEQIRHRVRVLCQTRCEQHTFELVR